jgi:hypothetical protein
MDEARCAALKRELSGMPEPQAIPIERFFDGNDDPASIGCNLAKHPGVQAFRDVLTGLLRHPGVQGVYAQIFEVDPGEEYWPFADTVLVVGSIPATELRTAVKTLKPDEVHAVEPDDLPALVAQQHRGSPVLAIWWD